MFVYFLQDWLLEAELHAMYVYPFVSTSVYVIVSVALCLHPA